MPRKLSRVQLDERLRTLEKDNTLLLQGLNDLAAGEVNWFSRFGRDGNGGRYSFGCSRLDGANGGLFFVKFEHDGQTPYTTVQLLDDEYAWLQRGNLTCRLQCQVNAIQRAVTMRAVTLNTKGGEANG